MELFKDFLTGFIVLASVLIAMAIIIFIFSLVPGKVMLGIFGITIVTIGCLALGQEIRRGY